jgi:hypothetical protein
MVLRTLALTLIASMGLACGGSSGGVTPSDAGTKDSTGDGTTGVTAAAACMARATAECTEIEKCEPFLIQYRYGSMNTCVTNNAANCLNSLAAPSTGNSPAITQACATAFPQWACADYFASTNPPAACKQVTGSLANGMPCGFAGQCTSGFCTIRPNALCGTCAAQPTAGDSCADLATCGQGLVCYAKTQTCVSYGASGASCDENSPCGYELSCVGADAKTGTAGKCQAAGTTVGTACDPELRTAAGCTFQLGLTCDTGTMKCVMTTAGSTCGISNDMETYCSAAGVCDADAGTCTASAGTGGTCDIGGPACIDPERCVGATDGGTSGTCQTANAASCK